ncbi:creatininase family protein [Limoniibacter endophyticus]|uniref:Creatininase n=1 Tax=Limoniibacter endophyticus TaxID=1565040 RepID=A0A8J3GGY2_9HYPH|nr:creatininase family protein [Limoniibacter endophyticus]GHC75446.1 creatininase [Limoniibacter endophyticus]
MTRTIWWEEFTAEDFEAIDSDRAIAMLPLAATEQHGPHLPLSTDTNIMRGMIAELAGKLPENIDLRCLPLQSVTKSDEHLFAPGTLHQEPELLIRQWRALGDAVARLGFRKMIFVTSHGGNEEIMGIVARDMRVRHGLLVVKSSWNRFGYPEGLLPPKEIAQGIHGGDLETSLMLHFRPELVRMDRAQDFVSSYDRAEETFDLLRPTGPFGFSWAANDINPRGVVGNAAIATAEKGKMIAQHQTNGMLRLLNDIAEARPEEWLASR